MSQHTLFKHEVDKAPAKPKDTTNVICKKINTVLTPSYSAMFSCLMNSEVNPSTCQEEFKNYMNHCQAHKK